ncbi:hypothetical protein SDC9_182028 [bioreactor metagenome]|uniref:Uncharacterized protein n=1 Tax=bioreactor metagenome TaxID=1076179 RepID=A0A645HEK9_9ZZZZ
MLGDFLDLRHGGNGRLRAEFLTQHQGVAGAVFDALTAGDALFRVHLCHKVGANGIPRAKHQPDAEPEAGAGAAVADCRGFSRFLNVRNVVHQSVLFGSAEDFLHLRARNLPCTTGANIVLRTLAHLNAHVLLQMAAAFADGAARRAAGTGGNGIDVVLVEIIRNALVGNRLRVGVDRAFNRDDAHEPRTHR